MVRFGWTAGAGIVTMALAMPAPAQAYPAQGGASSSATATDEDRRDAPVITVTATRLPIELQDAPATVTVIDAQRIADELATDIKDLVRFEPGVSVTRQPARFSAALGATGRAGNEGFTIRGIGGNRVLIQVDGVRVPDGFSFGAQAAGRGDYVDIGLVKSVEILRGPASALYGSDGLSGAISFVTSDPADLILDGKDFGGVLRAGWSSSDNEFAETAILAGRSGNWSAMAAYTRRDFEELDNKGVNDTATAARTTPNPQDGHSNAALGRIVYDTGSHRFRLTGEYLDNRLDTDVLSGRSAAVLNLIGNDSGKRARTSFDWTWDGSGTIEFARLGAYWQDAEDRQFTFEDRTPAVDRTRINTFENRVYGASGELRAGFATGGIRHRIVFGGDISFTRQRGLRDGTVPPVGETFPTRAFPETDYMLAGVFVSDEIALGPLTLVPALRFDAYDLDPANDPLLPRFASARQSGSRLSPKIGAVLAPGDGVRLFVNYTQGFKAPEPGQVNQFFENLGFGYTSRPNPDLGPEKSRSWEGGVRVFSDWVGLDITGFHADYDDFISQEVVSGSFTPTDPAVYQFVNLTSVRVRGAEGRLTAKDASGLNGSVALSYAKGDVTPPTGLRVPLSTIDPLKLVAGVGFDDLGRRFGGRVIMTHSDRKEFGRTTGVCTPGCFRPAAFTILDATAYVRITDALTLRGGLFNITDQKYAWWSDVRGLALVNTAPAGAPQVLVPPASADAYTQPGRNGSVSVSFRF